MKTVEANSLRIALYEGTGSTSLDGSRRYEIMRTLLEKGYHVTCIRSGGQVSEVTNGSMIVLGQFENGQAPQVVDSTGELNVIFKDISTNISLLTNVRYSSILIE